jgi:hypothetical protein
VRIEIAVHPQGGCVRSDLSQQSTFDEKPQVVVDRGQRNGWNAAPDCGVNAFGRMVSVGSDNGLIDHLPLVRDRQSMLRGQLTELFVGKTHDYRIRMSIEHCGRVKGDFFIAEELCFAELISQCRHALSFRFRAGDASVAMRGITEQ